METDEQIAREKAHYEKYLKERKQCQSKEPQHIYAPNDDSTYYAD